MDFLKKNWSRIVVAALNFLGFILIFIALICLMDSFGSTATFTTACQLIGPMVFFLGTAVYIVCKLIDQKSIAKWVLLGTGAIATVFMFVGLFGYSSAGIYPVRLFDTFKSSFRLGALALFPYFCQLIVFGLIPLVRGIAKVTCCGCCGKDKQTKKPAQPVTAQVKAQPKSVEQKKEQPQKAQPSTAQPKKA